MKTKRTIHLTDKFPTVLALPLFLAAATTNASTDYGPARWIPNCGQYSSSGYGHKFFVCHDMEGYYASTIGFLQNCNTTASVHYCVNGKKDTSSDYGSGDVTQMVRDSNYAFHAICWNHYSAGTEHEGFASNPAWYTDGLYDASAGVTRHASSVYGFAKDRNHIVGHNAKSSSAWCTYCNANFGCSATCNSHTDPGPYWDWSGYMDRVIDGNGPSNTHGPDAVSWGSGRIDVVVLGGSSDVFHKSYVSGSGWSGYENLGGNSKSSPSICSWGSGRLDVFTRGGDDTLIHKWYVSGSGWSGWESLGGTLTGGPDATCWGSGRIDVVVRGANNVLFHKSFVSGTGWSSYENIGGTATSDPSVCSWGSGRLDIFVRSGAADSLYHKSFSSGWSGWENLGGTLTSGPDSACWASGRIDIVVRSTNNEMYHKYYQSGSGFSAWENIGGTSTSTPGVSSWGSGRLDVFIRGTNNSLWHKFFGPTWGGWEDLGGDLY